MRRLFEDGTYSSNYCNWQLKSLLHLEQIVITFRTLLHLGQNDITFRPSTTRTLTRLELKVESKLDIPGFPTEAWGNSEIAYFMYLTSTVA